MDASQFARLPLGKKPFVPDHRDLLLKNYIDRSVLIDSEDCPLAHDWDYVQDLNGELPDLDRDNLGNNIAGNCVFAGPGHMVNMIGKQTGASLVVTRQMALDAYSKFSGYDQKTGSHDEGFYTRDMIKIWKSEGLYGTKALAFASVDWRDPTELAIASWIGCGTIGGFSLPLASQGQTDNEGDQLWDVPKGGFQAGQGPGTWGGHCIWCMRPSPNMDGGNSWGEETYWTRNWDNECCDERWLVLVDKWQMADGKAPNGFAFADLLADAQARAGSV